MEAQQGCNHVSESSTTCFSTCERQHTAAASNPLTPTEHWPLLSRSGQRLRRLMRRLRQ
jgi:hypothetical protein